MLKVDIPEKKRSLILPITVIVSVGFHLVLWAVLTEFGKRPISNSYLVQMVMKDKAPPTPEPDKPKPEKKFAESTPPPMKEETVQELLQKKTVEEQIKAEFKIENRDRTQTQITSLTTEFNRRSSGDNDMSPIPNLVNVGGRGSGDPGPPAKFISIGSGRKGGIGISTDGAGSVSINIGSGLGGGRGHGRGSGTGDGPDIPTVRLGGVGLGNGRGGGGGGGGSGINIGNLGSGGQRAKAAAGPTVQVNTLSTKTAATPTPGVSGEWVMAEVVGPIAQLQIKCFNNDGVHIFGNIKIQCSNNLIVAAWKRL